MSTTLDILNHVLSCISEDPVDTADSTLPSAQNIRRDMDRLDKEMQQRGWWFNTDYSLALSPDLAGNIILPDAMLRLTVPLTASYVQRGQKLYDPMEHTYIFTASVTVDIVSQLPIDDTPVEYTTYLQQKLAYDYYVKEDGDEGKANRLYREAMDAWAFLVRENLRQLRVTAINRPQVLKLLGGMQQQRGSMDSSLIGGR